jgi:hypothetical protein
MAGAVSVQPPPMPSMTLPVPPQVVQVVPLQMPLPWQAGQRFSPLPGVPGALWSPGSSGAGGGVANCLLHALIVLAKVSLKRV